MLHTDRQTDRQTDRANARGPSRPKKHIYSLILAITIADTSNVIEFSKVCKGNLDIESCIQDDKRKILLETDPSNQSFYVDSYRKVYCHE